MVTSYLNLKEIGVYLEFQRQFKFNPPPDAAGGGVCRTVTALLVAHTNLNNMTRKAKQLEQAVDSEFKLRLSKRSVRVESTTSTGSLKG